MRRIVVFISVVVLLSVEAFSQNYSATLAVGEVNVKQLKPGDDLIVPVILKEKSGGRLATFQLFIGFDHNLLSWKGTWEDPLPGIRNFNVNMPYSSASWVINDNGNQMVAVWDDPNFKGVDMKNGEVFFEIVFTYKGGLTAGAKSILNWGDTYEDIEGKLVRGKTELYDEDLKNFTLTTIDGILNNK
jgi:hypothetical protein